MTTAENIVCNVLNCGELDIETMFGKMTESGLFYDAYKSLVDMGCGNITANRIWAQAIDMAIRKVFGDEYCDDFEICPNCMGSSVSFLGDKDSIINFDEKILEFEQLTGFTLSKPERFKKFNKKFQGGSNY